MSMILWSCFLFLMLLHYYNFTSYDEGNLFFVLMITLISVCCFCFKIDNLKELRGQYLRVSNLFLLGFIIVHFQFYIDLLLGNFDLGRQDLVVNQNIIIKSAIISSIGLTSFFLGYIFKLKKIDANKFKETFISKTMDLTGLKILISLLFAVFIISTPFSYFMGGHISTELSALSQYVQSFFILTSIGYLILNTRNVFLMGYKAANFFDYVKCNGKFITVVLALFCFLIMMSGDRGPILQITLVYVSCYCILNRKKFSIFFVVAIIFLAAFIVSFLAYFRNFEGTANLVDMIQQSSEMKDEMVSSKQSFSPITFELSKSVRTMHSAVTYTEDNGYTYGVFQGFQLISIIPGVGQLIIPLFGMDSEMLKSSYFLTNQLDGDHGLGTTVVADIWLDFGILGIILGFYIFGYFLRKIDEYTYSHLPLNIFWYVIIAIFLSKAFYIGRSTIIVLFRDVTFCYLLLLIGVYLIRPLRTSKKLNV
ncbi:hypothetical protein D3C87_187360 [compost metagenome]